MRCGRRATHARRSALRTARSKFHAAAPSSRVISTEAIKEQMQRLVGYGMALEGLAISDPTSGFPTA